MGINYSVEADPNTTAKGMLRDRPISIKHSRTIPRAIKGMPVADAEEYLEAVIGGERSVPFKQHNSGVGHRSDINGWDAGRYPEEAPKALLELLENIRNNATEQEFDGPAMEIKHVAAHKAGECQGREPRAFGRVGPWDTPICNAKLIIEETEE